MKIMNFISEKQRGIALFVAMLMSMSLAVVAMTSMAKLSEMTHTSGKGLEERKLLMYAQSAANIVSGEIQQMIDSELNPSDDYSIYGITGEGSYKFYPRDIFVNPDLSGTPSLFGYRARARLFASNGDAPPGFATGNTVPANGRCYDITIDVREVIYIPTGNADSDGDSDTDMSKYYLGKMKTIGIISCFQKG
jgi:hypothetical protein